MFLASLPDTRAKIEAGANEVLALAERLDAAAVQDSNSVLLSLHLSRLEPLAYGAETADPVRGDCPRRQHGDGPARHTPERRPLRRRAVPYNGVDAREGFGLDPASSARLEAVGGPADDAHDAVR